MGNFSIQFESGKTFEDSTHYHLIDLSDPSTFTFDLEVAPESKVTRISFGIGVDSLANAKGLMSGDLDPMNGMYWAWSSGFINFKMEGELQKDASIKEFSYHIGGFLKPNETYKSVVIQLKNGIEIKEGKIVLNCNLKPLFESYSIIDHPKILSPSVKAKTFSFELPQLFTVAQ